MTNERFKLIIPVLALVFAITLLSACRSSPGAVLQEPMKPDSQSAVVYFYHLYSSNTEVWDGEVPVGTFAGVPKSSIGVIHWRAKPGAHTFVARATNTAHIKMDLQANRIYYIEVARIPTPYTTVVALREISQEREETIRRRYRIKDLSFSDEWRQTFATENNGRRLNAVREYLAGIQ